MGYLMALVLDKTLDRNDFHKISEIALKKGLAIALQDNIIKVTPPLNILNLKLEKGLDIMNSVLEEFSSKYL
jgi:4-aminobutyrate aminotransferase-like enzyme